MQEDEIFRYPIGKETEQNEFSEKFNEELKS